MTELLTPKVLCRRVAEWCGAPLRFGSFGQDTQRVSFVAWCGAGPISRERWGTHFPKDVLDALTAELEVCTLLLANCIHHTVCSLRDFEIVKPGGDWLTFGFDAGPHTDGLTNP